ncbi:GntR family transcriptional regulator, partial [Bacillus sp. AFS040349]|uniref:GntR family transcriptional regulator n=1 Tax=Bacillus sp. AFS040349 TaxID=2033502 RepID=UPI000C038455
MKTNFENHALSNSIAKHITDQIISGDLKPGEKLVEHIYAEEYGTSRAPVREAIYLLAIEGLVERIPRKGAVVKEYSEHEIYDLLEIRNMLEKVVSK